VDCHTVFTCTIKKLQTNVSTPLTIHTQVAEPST